MKFSDVFNKQFAVRCTQEVILGIAGSLVALAAGKVFTKIAERELESENEVEKKTDEKYYNYKED